MKDPISTIEGKSPETVQPQDMPFEIVIRTKDPAYIAGGGETEKVIPCDGYMLFTTIDDGTELDAQGRIIQQDIARGIARVINKNILIAAALTHIGGSMDEPE